MPALLPDVDPDGLLEYSVVYTHRALNHMSRFRQVMLDVGSVPPRTSRPLRASCRRTTTCARAPERAEDGLTRGPHRSLE